MPAPTSPLLVLLIGLVTNVGFPIAICIYLITFQSRQLNDLVHEARLQTELLAQLLRKPKNE